MRRIKVNQVTVSVIIMKTITDLKTIAGILMPQENIMFSGPPSSLHGKVIFENAGNEDFHLSDLTLEHEKLEQLKELRFDAFQIHSDLKVGQRLLQTVRISLDQRTPPGSHELDVMIGGIKKKIILNIQANIRVEVTPGEIVLFGTLPGKSHHVSVQVLNRGNVPVLLPSGVFENELNDRCVIRCLTSAVKENPEKTPLKTLGAFFGNVKKELENSLIISVEKPEQLLNPGENAVLPVVFTIPSHIEAQKQYEGSIRISYDKLSYRILE
jgi:hypothetical protein